MANDTRLDTDVGLSAEAWLFPNPATPCPRVRVSS